MDYFADLGKRIEERWRAVDRDEESFPDLAVEELDRTPPLERLNTDDIVRSFLDVSQQADRQFAPVGAFGQPGLTMYYGRGFLIDVYFWNNSVPAIHNHPFTGCFTILKGFTLHRTYTFEEKKKLGARVMLGDIKPERLDLLREGDRVRFSLLKHPLIHSLVHVPNPSISMVIRTARTLEYFRYLPPSVALAVDEPDELITRQIRLLDWMRNSRHPDYLAEAAKFLAGADFDTAFRVISAAWGEGVEALLEAVGDRADLIRNAVARAVRLQKDNEVREQFLSDNDRMVASILMCAHNRDEVLRLIREWFGDEDPQTVFSRWAESVEVDKAALAKLVNGEKVEGPWEETIFRSLLT